MKQQQIQNKVYIPSNFKRQLILPKEFINNQLTKNKLFRKMPKKSLKYDFNTPQSRTTSPKKTDRKYNNKSGLSLQRSEMDKEQQVQKFCPQNSIFRRRINSQQKVPKKNLISLLETRVHTPSSKLNLAKKLIQDIKKQNIKMRKPQNNRYQKNNQSKSMELRSKRLVDKEKILQSSLQKLKPSFYVNEVQLTKKISDNLNKVKFNSSIDKLQQKSPKKITQKKIERSQFLLNLLKQAQNIPSYLQYIKGKSSQKYSISTDFLKNYLTTPKTQIFLHIDITCLKLLQSIYLCIIDILQNTLENDNKIINFQIIREYSIVYFQAYTKLKIQYILAEVILKTIKTKLTKYFILQRILFFYLLQSSFMKNIEHGGISLKKLVEILKINEEILVYIINLLLQSNQINKTEQNAFFDSFKFLRLSRELDKKLPIIRQLFETFEGKRYNVASKIQTQNLYKEINKGLNQLFQEIEAQQNFDIKILFKIEMIYCWKQFMIPPIFFLPATQSKPYTLIIDLDATLVYYNQQTRILKYRPYMDRFLSAMANDFELIIFSSYAKQRTDVIVKEIEREQHIFSYRLYKSHMVFLEGSLRKNISFLGRNLQKTILIDDEDKNTKWLPSNSFQIKPFTGDKQDKQLLNLSDWLSALMQQKPLDIRGKLKKPQQFLQQIVQIDEVSSTIQRSIQYE